MVDSPLLSALVEQIILVSWILIPFYRFVFRLQVCFLFTGMLSVYMFVFCLHVCFLFTDLFSVYRVVFCLQGCFPISGFFCLQGCIMFTGLFHVAYSLPPLKFYKRLKGHCSIIFFLWVAGVILLTREGEAEREWQRERERRRERPTRTKLSG